MFTINEYAQLSAHVYHKTPENEMPMPLGFQEAPGFPWQVDDNDTGFSAGVYIKDNEVVISFTGTNQDLKKDFVRANIQSGLGLSSVQIHQAIDLVAEVTKRYGDKNISFTGHSLGGGLASVMGVLFNNPSAIFDAAPFAKSAWSQEVLRELHNIVKREGGNADFESYLNFSLLIDNENYKGKSITFTGHSLGGGLASAIGIRKQ